MDRPAGISGDGGDSGTAGQPRVVFVDNPAIVDPHPMLAESWSRVADQQAVALHFTTGTPECYGVHATVAETAETVTVELREGALPGAVAVRAS